MDPWESPSFRTGRMSMSNLRRETKATPKNLPTGILNAGCL
ncbi:hypothetical protein CCP3SC1AL1_1520001 [Gammaproteobacteria bacterium]